MDLSNIFTLSGDRLAAKRETRAIQLQQYVEHLREARAVWASDPEIRGACGLLGMDEREYADRYLAVHHGGIPLVGIEYWEVEDGSAEHWRQRFLAAWKQAEPTFSIANFPSRSNRTDGKRGRLFSILVRDIWC